MLLGERDTTLADTNMMSLDRCRSIACGGSLPKSASHKDITKRSRVVAHNAIDAKVKQSGYFEGVVNGPHMNLDPKFMGDVDKALCCHGYWTLLHWHLGHECMIGWGKGQMRGGASNEFCDLFRTH
jgi:hypothetical protein